MFRLFRKFFRFMFIGALLSGLAYASLRQSMTFSVDFLQYAGFGVGLLLVGWFFRPYLLDVYHDFFGASAPPSGASEAPSTSDSEAEKKDASSSAPTSPTT